MGQHTRCLSPFFKNVEDKHWSIYTFHEWKAGYKLFKSFRIANATCASRFLPFFEGENIPGLKAASQQLGMKQLWRRVFFFDNGYQISCMLYIYIYYVVSVKALLAPDRAFNWLRFFSAIWVTKRKGMPEMYDVTVPRWFNTFACSPAHSLHDAFTFYYGHSPVWFPILNESYPHDAHIRVYVRSVKCLRDSVLAGGG